MIQSKSPGNRINLFYQRVRGKIHFLITCGCSVAEISLRSSHFVETQIQPGVIPGSSIRYPK